MSTGGGYQGCVQALTADDIEHLKRFMIRTSADIDKLLETVAKQPEFLAKLAAEGKTVADLPDLLPLPFPPRVAFLVLQNAIYQATQGQAGALPSSPGPVPAPAQQQPLPASPPSKNARRRAAGRARPVEEGS